MKKILVPVDFSENSINALEYAIVLAREFKADIRLAHAFFLSPKTGMFISVQDRMRENALEDIRNLAEKYQRRLPEGNIMDYRIIRDHAQEGIAALAEQAQADLIVMGTKGASRAKGVLWGSVASGVIAKTTLPLITVPEGYPAHLPKHAVLAVDDPGYNNADALLPLVGITRQVGTSITSFHAMSVAAAIAGEDGTPSDYLRSISDDYHQSFNQNVKESLLDYIGKNNVDLLCMIRKEQGFIRDLVRRSHTRQTVFECPVPMLILHESK